MLLDDGTHKYVWGLGLAFAVDQAGNPLVYHTDGLGSVRALTDGSGSVVQTYQYDEYGNVVASNGSITQPFQYPGEVRDDETGFTYLRARMYDSATGRFLTRDVESGRADAPETLHKYGYVADNPMLGTDPSGFGMIVPCKSPSGGIKNADPLASILCDVIDPTDMPSVILGASETPEGAAFPILYRLYSMAARPIGGVITGFTKHGINRVIERGIRPYEILDTVSNAIRVTLQNNDTIRYVGRWAMIVVNKAGEVVTAVRFKPPWAP